MKKINLLILIIIIFSLNLPIASAQDCSKFEKLTKEYAECNTNLVKKKAKLLKNKASSKIDDGKKKFNKSKFKETLIKFKNSKSHKEFIEKLKNDN
tara:strand:+ start:785 stop:1072 length:288 start_codon:yes stop_codon:yes gene_type:complete